MTVRRNKLLIGSSSFAGIRLRGAYYVDKTKHLRAILDDGSLAKLITRPRRFGKSLMMSTLQSFLETDYENPSSSERQERLFSGIDVMKDRGFCQANMGKWPVIALSFKDVDGSTFAQALNQLAEQISNAALRVRFLRDSERLPPEIREQIGLLCDLSSPGARLSADELIAAVCAGIRDLEHALAMHFGRSVIVLIDKCDAPLAKACEGGFFGEMRQVISLMLGAALEDSGDLRKAVLTGCLRIASGSVFTGLGCFACRPASDSRLGEAFGFTEAETRKVLEDFGLARHAREIESRYGGRRFGEAEIYSPWDVLNFCREARQGAAPLFPPYWADTSGNSLVDDFIDRADESHFEVLSELLKGKSVPARIDEAIPCSELEAGPSPSALMNVLCMTGYLTRARVSEDGQALLRIPNLAVRECFEKSIDRHFSARGKDFLASAQALARSLVAGEIKDVRKAISGVLDAYASVRDSAAEGFYRGFMNGLLASAVSAGGKGSLKSRFQPRKRQRVRGSCFPLLGRGCRSRPGIQESGFCRP